MIPEIFLLGIQIIFDFSSLPTVVTGILISYCALLLSSEYFKMGKAPSLFHLTN